MIKAYTASDLQQAHLLLGLLQAAGIEARILNANAQGGLGEIPFVNTYPEIWLADERDLPRARSVLETFERPAPVGPPQRCSHCGEENPAAFEICWSCSTPFCA